MVVPPATTRTSNGVTELNANETTTPRPTSAKRVGVLGGIAIGLAALAVAIFAPLGIRTTTNTNWKAPLGCPVPEFGAVPITAPATIFVDNTHPASADGSNPGNSPERPRKSIPEELPAGAVVEVRGGPYSYGSTGYIVVRGHGTAIQPIVVRGVGLPRFTQKIAVYGPNNYESSYIQFAGLDLYKWEVNPGSSHLALINSKVRNGGGVTVAGTSSFPVAHIAIIGNEIAYNGDYNANYDQDQHGITVGGWCSDISVYDNVVHHNGGDGIQINAGSRVAQAGTNRIWVANNTFYTNKQVGFLTKQSTDTVFAWNVSYDHQPRGSRPSAWGAGGGFQYDPERVWFIGNVIYDCCFGIQSGSGSGMGSGTECFILGNIIYNIQPNPLYPPNPNTAWSNSGINLVGVHSKYIMHNTLHNCYGGINVPGAGDTRIIGNIVSACTNNPSVFLEDAAHMGVTTITRNVFYQANGDPLIRVDGTTYHLPVAWGTNSSDPPYFKNPASGDFRIGWSGSPAVDAADSMWIYDRYQSLYGMSIAFDAAGRSRKVGVRVDAGAYEQQ